MDSRFNHKVSRVVSRKIIAALLSCKKSIAVVFCLLLSLSVWWVRYDIAMQEYMKKYITARHYKVNPYNYSFLIDGRDICEGHAPFLLIIVPSAYSHQLERRIVRKTWGSVVKTRLWADGTKLPTIKLMFLLGIQTNSIVSPILAKEIAEHRDIVVADFQDTYRNLTLKTMAALLWASKYCFNTKYLLKHDDDSFVHLPRLIEVLRRSHSNEIIGRVVKPNSFGYIPVVRSVRSRSYVSRQEYPPDRYPPYIYGSFYAMPRNLISKLLNMSEYVPFVPMEDAFITGMVASNLGVTLKNIDTCPSIWSVCPNPADQVPYKKHTKIDQIEQEWKRHSKIQ